VKRSKKRRNIIIVVLVLIALLAGGVLFLLPRKDSKRVVVAPVESVPELKAIVDGTGEIRTEQLADIQTEIAGVIVELPVHEGDRVQKGQVLLKVDPTQTQADVEAARYQLSSLQADAAGQTFQIASCEANIARDEFLKKSAEVELTQSEANLARARETFNREKKLLGEHLTSPDQYEVVETQFKVNQAQVDASRANIARLEATIKASRASLEYAKAARDSLLQRVEGARANVQRCDDLLKKTVIRSPMDGVVVKLNVNAPGERAVPGNFSMPQATLMTVADLNVIEAELKVDETDIVNVEKGQTGKVEVDALPDTPLTGRVIEIGNSPILATGSTQEGKDFKVKLRIDNPPPTIRPGMSCQAEITTKVRREVQVVPIQALTMREVRIDTDGKFVPRPREEKGGAPVASAQSARERKKELQGVFLVGPGGLALFRPVKTGITGEMDIEVLEGLALGEEVVVGPLKALRTLEENDRIEVDRSKPFRRHARKRGAGAEAEEEK
jgi:HlyD family secretion protein